MYKSVSVVLLFSGVVIAACIFMQPAEVVSYAIVNPDQLQSGHRPDREVESVESAASVQLSEETPVQIQETRVPTTTPTLQQTIVADSQPHHIVPFYSQFADITEPQWQKVGCGIASVAMLIDFYADNKTTVDDLLEQGIKAGYFLSDAGWTHQGLINLTKQFGLDGVSVGLQHLSMDSAFDELESIVTQGPVMVSVHYTFQPTNPIPHLAVITGIDTELVYYNDPADLAGGNSISIAQFKSAWKKRYISIRPV